MKTRIISGIIIAVILIGIWALIFTPVFDIFFAVISGAACFEIMRAAGIKNKELLSTAVLFSFVFVLGIVYPSRFPLSLLTMFYIIFLVILTVIHHEEIGFEKLAVTVYSSLIIPAAFSTISLVADSYKFYSFIDRRETVLLIWYGACCALFTDVFAYFVGVKFGKTKMTPLLSPKKSWEGAVGGTVLVIVLNLISYFVFNSVFAVKAFAFPLWLYLLASPLLSVAGIFGDLAASLIKRNYGIKDFSNFIPGHGGIMDRFDSILLVFPVYYILISIYGTVVSA